MGFYKILASSYRLTNIFSTKNIKKIVLFLFIGLVLFLFFSNNSFAVEEGVTINTVSNIAISNNGEIVETAGNSTLAYFEVEPGYQYTITNGSNSSKRFGFSDVLPSVGIQTYEYNLLTSGSTYSFSKLNHSYAYFDLSFYDDNVTISRDYIGGYDYVSKDLANTFSVSNLWGQLGFAVPLIGLAVLFALGFFVVRKLTKGEGKAKVKF